MRFLLDGHLPPSPEDERTPSPIRLRLQRPMTYLQRNFDGSYTAERLHLWRRLLPFYDQSGCRSPESFRTSTSCSRTLLSLRPEGPRTPTYSLLRIPQLRTNPDVADLQQERQHDFNDNAPVITGAFQREGPAHYSRIDMLRPKVFIIPAPLQDQQQQPTKPSRMICESSEDTTGPRPMPPGAKTTGPRPWSTMFGAGEQGIGFTPNPRSSLSLAQLTFRNMLMTGGERDVAFADIEANLQRAEGEGVQVDLGLVPEEAPEPPRRAPGKLYGHSLMDELEARKNQLEGKQRYVQRDHRPNN